MRPIKLIVVVLPFLPVLVSLTGCTSGRPEIYQYSRTTLEGIDFDASFAAVQSVMRAQFGQITSSKELAEVKSLPRYTTGNNFSLSNQQQRQTAFCRLIQQNNQWWVYIQVLNERQDSNTYRQFNNQRSGRDYDLATPMETGESLPVTQRQLWSKLGRDRAMEKMVLARIRQALKLDDITNPTVLKKEDQLQ